MNKIKQYLKERGFDANYILINNYNSKITIGNILEGFENFEEKRVKKLTIPVVSGSFSQNDMENFAAKCMILGSSGKTMDELLKAFCDNDL